MNFKSLPVILSLALFLPLFNVNAAEQNNDDDISAQLLSAYRTNLEGMAQKNIDKVLSVLHPQSPAYEKTKNTLANAMQSLNLSYKIVGLQYMGRTGEYAVIRIIQQTYKTGGTGAFTDNMMDALQIFKLDSDGKWKLWASCVLQSTPLKSQTPDK